MIDTLLDVVGVAAVALGLGFATVALYGLLRMPDVFAQLHAAGLINGPSLLLVLVGAVATRSAEIVTSAALVFLFVLITAPLSGHAVAKAGRDRARSEE